MSAMGMKTKTITLISGCCLMACGIAAVAEETKAAAGADKELSEIVVTASRREQRLIDVPIAVTALSGDTLGAQGLTQIQDFVAKVPGFSIEETGRTGLRLVLRGQNTGGAGASVATMVDDVILNSATANSAASTVTSNFETFDLERIEVLRGPQGTLYGATAEGGLLKYVTKKPVLDKFEGAVELGTESVRYGETGYSAKGMVNLPVSDKLAFRVSAFYKDVPGYIDNPLLQLKDANGGKQYGARAALLFKPTDALALRLTVSEQKQGYGAEGLVEINGSPLANQETSDSYKLVSGEPISRRRIPERSDFSTTYYNAVVDYDFDKVALTSSTSYVQVRSSLLSDITDLGFGFAGIAASKQSNDHNKFNQEVRLSSKGDGGFKWLVGGFFSNEHAFWPFVINSLDPAAPTQPLIGLLYDSNQYPTYKEFSGFGDMTIPLSDRFEVSIGGRYTRNKQDFRGTFAASLFSGPVDFETVQPTASEGKFTYSFAPRFKLSEDVSLYARIASGYRPGGPVPNFSAQAIPGYPVRFGSDTTTNFEVGAKGAVANGRFSFDVAAYRINWKNVQIQTGYDVNGVVFYAIGNGGNARSQGLEWSFNAEPVDNLKFSLNGSYTDATLTEDALGLGAVKGARLPFVPKISNAISVDYAINLSDALKLNLGTSWTHVGERYATFIVVPGFSNNPRVEGYDTLDFRAGLDFKRYAVDLLLRNATDSAGLTTYQSITGYNSLNGQGTMIQPRTIALRLSAKF